MANLDYNDFRRRDCVWRMVLPANSLKLLNGGMAPSYSGHPARAPPGARASTSSDRSTAASTASFNPVPLQTAKVVLGRVLINAGIGRMYALGANRTRRDGERFVTARIEKIARKIAGLNTPSRPAPPLGSWV